MTHFKIFIAELDFRMGDKFDYNYDFGDDWEHEIRIEKIESINTKYKFPISTERMKNIPLKPSALFAVKYAYKTLH